MVTQLKKGDFEEGVKLEERWLTSDAPARSTKIAADTTFVDKTEGDIPITQAESIARKNVEAMGKVLEPVKDYIFDPVYKAWDVGGRRVVDKLNPLSKDFFKRRKEQSEHYEKQKSQAFAAYREKREKTQDYLGLLADKYKTKADEVRATQGDEAADAILEEYFASKARIMQSAGLKQTDLEGTPIDLDTYMLRDDMGLWTDNPDPYPWIQFGEKFAATVYGTNKGYKAGEKLLTKKNVQKLNNVFKAASKRGPWYIRVGAWAGRGATHPWTIKTLGALGIGGAGWGAADFGYELQLDALNAAGKGKAYLESSDDVRAQLIGKAIPEFLTFGPQGINRPGIGQRSFNAIDEAVTDMALTAPFFLLRPAYVGLRSIAGSAPGIKMFDKGWVGKPKEARTEFGETTAMEDLLAAEHIWKKWGGDSKQIEKAGFNVPFVGNALTRITQSNVFDWLGTGGLSLLPKLFPKSKALKGFETPKPGIGHNQPPQIIVPMGKYMFSDAYIGGASKILGRAPWLGGRLVNRLERHSNNWAKAFNNMLGDMAPISHLAGMRELDLGKIMHKSANNFTKKARELNEKIIAIGATHGSIINDKALKEAAVAVKNNRLRYWQIKNVDGKPVRMPPEGGDPLVNFINSKILYEGAPGARTVQEQIGLKNELFDLLKKHRDLDYVDDDVLRIMKGWDTDIGRLADVGLDDLSKSLKEYDEFVANGLMLYGSDIAKKAGMKTNMVGTDLRLSWDAKRAGQSLFDTILKSGTPQDVQIVKKLVGDQAFAEGVELYIRNAFNNALGESAGGIRQFNFKQFKKDLGLVGGNTMERRIFDEALNNSNKIVIRGRDPRTGQMRDFSDEMWLGMAPSGRFADDAAEFAKKVDGDVIRRNVPTLDDWQKFVQVLERTYKHGIPDVSAFMARKAVISNVNSGLTAFLPWSGQETVTKGAAGMLSMGVIKSLVGAWLLRYGGHVMGSPPSMRALRNTLDDTLSETVNLSNFVKLINRHPEEWEEFRMDLLELENAQQEKEAGAERMRDLRGRGEKLKDSALNLGGEILETVPKALDLYDKVVPDKIGNVPLKNVPLIHKGGVEMGIDAAKEALEAEEAGGYDVGPQSKVAPATEGFGTNVAAPGSSIAMHTTINPGAASALYAGDTDAALAAQYGGGSQYGAQGGMMNPVMGNDGKYTEIQTGMNDNPFVKNAKNKGIMGVL